MRFNPPNETNWFAEIFPIVIPIVIQKRGATPRNSRYKLFFGGSWSRLLDKHFVTDSHICTSFIVFPMQFENRDEKNIHDYFGIYSTLHCRLDHIVENICDI